MRISRVYTKTGDDGTTMLVGGQRVRKDDLRIQSYGTSDELMSFIGWARTLAESERERFLDPADTRRLDRVLEYLINLIFTLNTDLATRHEDRWPDMPTITPADIEYLEKVLDSFNAGLPPLLDFVLPGGTRTSSALHVARTVARRAERLVVSLSDREMVAPHVICFLNRLSDLLFVLARWANLRMGVPEVIWRRDLPRPETSDE